jgi:DNA invertase Pin-like site-specific DNA recombinase
MPALASDSVSLHRVGDARKHLQELRAALEACKKDGAALLIAKLDRLGCNVHFVTDLITNSIRFNLCFAVSSELPDVGPAR